MTDSGLPARQDAGLTFLNGSSHVEIEYLFSGFYLPPRRGPPPKFRKNLSCVPEFPARPPGAAGHPAGLGRKGIPDTQNTTLKEFNEHMTPLIYHLFGTVSRVCQRKKQYLCGCREFFRRDFLLSSRAEAAGRGWIGNHLRTSS